MEIPANAQLPSDIGGQCCAVASVGSELLVDSGTVQLRIAAAAQRCEQLSNVFREVIAIVPQGSLPLVREVFCFKVVVESAKAAPCSNAEDFFLHSAEMMEELSQKGFLELDKQLQAEYLAPIKVQLFRQSFEKYVEQHKHQLDAAVRRRYKAKCEEQCEYYRQLFALQVQEEAAELKAQMGRMRRFLCFLEAQK